jgi:hypothetical protein
MSKIKIQMPNEYQNPKPTIRIMRIIDLDLEL